MSRLTTAQVALQLEDLTGWQQESDAIVKTYIFKDFATAFSFMTHVAFHAEALEHHPQWHNDYNTVSFRLTTADINGISSQDIRLAKRIEEVARTY